ncbi:unnamed protein product [Closterium sp. Naga37s-1]|nr:unnamed protein product [Closterium sp. Naga37s-1]
MASVARPPTSRTSHRRSASSRHFRALSPLPALLLAACCHLALSPDRGVLPVTRATPQVPWDNFTSPCTPLPDPPPAGFKLWSDAATWPGGVVPGVGAGTGGNATIPCGVAVLLNVPSVVLSTLTIRGMLKIEDTTARPLVQVNASFVIVEGQLIAGSSTKHFSQKVVFTLTPNPNGRAPYQYTANAPADPSNPRNFGNKAFVVVRAVGGQVSMHGMPGGSSTPSWCRLAATAQAGDRAIMVDRDVTAWPVGFYVGLASTDFYADQIDTAKIVAVTAMPGGSKWRVALSAPLSYSHFGELVSDGFGGTIDERGEVMLLNRTVTIRGEDEAAPHNWEGGHFMVFFTQTAQLIEGVEFAQMGQQGQLGRYNIHFHLCGNQAGKSVVRKNVIHDSKQRCVVVHATFNLTVEENVAFNTRGDCFMVEEGGEQGNSFIRNVGIWTRAVEVKISSEETDDEPSTFWITNANNNYIGNVAAGSEDTGCVPGWVAGWVGGWGAGWLGGWLGGWVAGWVAGWLAGWVGGWVGLPGSRTIGRHSPYSPSQLHQLSTSLSLHPTPCLLHAISFWLELWERVRGLSAEWPRINTLTPINSNTSVARSFPLFLRERVRGLSAEWPQINTLIPFNYHRVGTFAGNVAHSCEVGFRDYPGGFKPRFNATTLDEAESYVLWVTISGFTLYKNTYAGSIHAALAMSHLSPPPQPPHHCSAFIHNTDYVVFDGFTAADNVWGVEMHQVEGIVMRDLTVVGHTANYGNPFDCTDPDSNGCAPVSGCKFPVAEGQQGRSVGDGGWEEPVYGLVFTQSPWFTDGLFNNVVDGARFAGFDSTCKPSAAVAVGGDMGTYWNAGNNFKYDQSETEDHGEAAAQVALRDMDGSIVGSELGKASVGENTFPSAAAAAAAAGAAGTGEAVAVAADGFARPMANNTALLPPLTPSGTYGSCKPMPAANAYACPSPAHCFRTVNVRYSEPATAGNTNRTQAHGVMSFIKVVRASDGAQQTFDGNSDHIELEEKCAREEGGEEAERLFGFTALVVEVYVVEVVGPDGKEEWQPQEVDVFFGDGVDKDFAGSCGGAVTVRFKAPAGGDTQWAVRMADNAAWRSLPLFEKSTLHRHPSRLMPPFFSASLLSHLPPSSGPHPSAPPCSPCSGTTQRAPALFSYECDEKSEQQQVQVVLSGDVDYYLPAALYVSQNPPAPFSTVSHCGLVAPRAVWRYNQEGGELHPRYPGGPAFYNPNFPDSSWPSGPAPLAYVDYDWNMVGTFLMQPSWDARTTYYFRTSFSLTNSACVSHLLLQMPVNDGVIVYINNREVLRLNMPQGDVTNATSHTALNSPAPSPPCSHNSNPSWLSPFPSPPRQALSDKEGSNDNGFIYTEATVKLPGEAAAPVLVDGVNVVAAEVHINQDDGWDIAWALRLSALPT